MRGCVYICVPAAVWIHFLYKELYFLSVMKKWSDTMFPPDGFPVSNCSLSMSPCKNDVIVMLWTPEGGANGLMSLLHTIKSSLTFADALLHVTVFPVWLLLYVTENFCLYLFISHERYSALCRKKHPHCYYFRCSIVCFLWVLLLPYNPHTCICILPRK